MRRIGRAALAVAAVLAGAGAGAQGGSALRDLAGGEWAIHDIGQKSGERRICLRDPRQLAHLDHPAGACRRSLVRQEGRSVAVRYVCPGIGAGMTQLRIETPVIVRVQTQGLVRGAPFDRDLEARRIGACRPPLTASLRN